MEEREKRTQKSSALYTVSLGLKGCLSSNGRSWEDGRLQEIREWLLLDDSVVWPELWCSKEQGSAYSCNTYHYLLVFVISKLVLERTPSPISLFQYPYPPV